ncbi:MAG: AAA family ATPase, partial [Myxococcota bacterium]
MRTIAIVNQKGGCGKTTTAVNLAGCLATAGDRVLLVDLDPQAHSTLALGIEPETLSENLYEVLVETPGSPGAARLGEVIRPWNDQLHVAPSGIVLSALEQKLTSEKAEQRTERLTAALESVADRYDWCLIDCPPNVGVLTFNALRAAREVIVPLETSDFAIHGVQKLLETIALLTERIGHHLEVR